MVTDNTQMQMGHPIKSRLLSERYSIEFLKSVLRPKENWRPFPKAGERDFWRSLPDVVRQSHFAMGEESLAASWPDLPASMYLQFSEIGDRHNYETPYFERRTILGSMMIAECIEGQGRYHQKIFDSAWSICEESSWCIPAHISTQVAGVGLPDTSEPIVDLFAAETAALLAWMDYLVGPAMEKISPLFRPRIYREVQTRVLVPALERDDFWWLGFTPKMVNNWTPWICSNWLTCVLLIENDAERRAAAVFKIMESLDVFISSYPSDGGCDEGPSYWGRAAASLLDCLELLYSASGGKIDVFSEPLIQEMGRFIYRVHIDEDNYINFADAPARLTPDPSLVFRYGKQIGDEQMMAFGAYLAEQCHLFADDYAADRDMADSPGRVLPFLTTFHELAQVEPRPPRLCDVWMPGLQVMAARDDDCSDHCFYVAAKGGHNDENHNHNDVGNYIVYIHGRPLIVDAGVETYTRKTFSSDRYEIWTMQSAYHTLPTIDGVMQSPGREFAARDINYTVDDDQAQFSLDMAGAYPPEAHLASWRRVVTLKRQNRVKVLETYELLEPVQEITISMLTPCQVIPSVPGLLVLAESEITEGKMSGAGQVYFDPELLSVTTEEIPIQDEKLSPVWGSRLTRILFYQRTPPLQGSLEFTILS